MTKYARLNPREEDDAAGGLFILNIPVEELASIERICFQIEEAQWFYEDFIRPQDPQNLPSISLKPFFHHITQRCPLFQDMPYEDMSNAFEKFLKYKNRVPVRGVIMLNDRMDEVLLVKGWKKNGTWSFPRGKINKGEDDLDCAIREAWEETGFDLRAAGLANDPKKIKYIEKTMRSQNMKLFVFRAVPRDTHFVPQTRKEISKIEWFRLADLPTEKKRPPQEGSGHHLVLSPNKFYVVAPFMHELKKIINAERKRDNRQSSKLAAPPMTIDSFGIDPEPRHPHLNLPAVLSPAVPSSLPEVTHAPASDQSLHPIEYFSPAPAVQTQPVDAVAKSNALRTLLGVGSTTDDPQTSFEQTRSPEQPPQRPLTGLHQQVHPTAPPPSALPQLSQHTRSLLDAFNRPDVPPTPSVQALSQLTAAKQDLLAAFSSKPTASNLAPTRSQSSTDQGSHLLQLLQKKDHTRDSASPQLIPRTSTISLSKESKPDSHSGAQPTSNPLLDLLRTKPSRAADPPRQTSNTIPSSVAASNQALSHPEPAELSATAENEAKPTPKTKAGLLSLLVSPPAKAVKNPEPKSRIGTTSATLDMPIDQPEFDAIVRGSITEEEIKRDPVTSERKLFDPKTGSVKQVTPIKIASRQDDRSKPPKSPRNIRPKQPQSPRRQMTPKEPPKPFQPQILRRPQTSDIDEGASLPSILSKSSIVDNDDEQMSSSKPSPARLPLSPSIDAPQPALVSSNVPRQTLSPIHDPQREALLSLLRAPIPQPPAGESELTPKVNHEPIPAHQVVVPLSGIVSPLSANPLVSPVMDGENDTQAPRSRVSSLASAGNGVPGVRPYPEKRKTAAGDKAFLMQYLKGFATQEAT